MTGYDRLLGRTRLVRRRWRLQKLAQGAALLSASAVALLLLGLWGADLFGFSGGAVWAARIIAAGSATYAAVRFIWLPSRRRISDVQCAQYVEERFPQLQDRLVSAVEFGTSAGDGLGMVDLLIRDTLEKSSRLDFSIFVDRRMLAIYGAVAAVPVLFLGALLLWGPSFFRYGFQRLYVPWTQSQDAAAVSIRVSPGDKEIARGSDQQIEASLVGFDSQEVRVLVQPEGWSAWQPAVMEPRPQGSSFQHLLVDVQQSVHYYVMAGGVRSNTHALRVIDHPAVRRIDLTYTFPSYTGMQPQTLENEGDISALKGTRVDLKISLTSPAESGRLVFADGSLVQLARSAEKTFSGSLTLKESGSYVVQLGLSGTGTAAGSREYLIEVLEDAPPRVTITKPLRDVRATSVEEVFAELKAEDDIGLGRVDVRYSVNGEPEKTVALYGGRPRLSSVTGTHTFFLEELGLQPGDVVSYYGMAADNNSLTGSGTSTSDMYFIQVRPFEQRYMQSQQSPGSGESGEGQESLSRQQKDIIAATFRLIRDGASLDPKEYSDSLNSLALVQSRLQVQTQNVVDRMQRRGAASVDESFSRLSENLRNAVVSMGKAAAELGARKPKGALPEEQKALQQLMRAESIFKDIQVSFGGQRGQGSSAGAEDLADLFELELNKLKNQYETIQRGEQRVRDQQLDEATQRLKELARRQQQLNERTLQLGQRGSGEPGQSGAGRSQQQLLDEAARLQRQLQKLSRERSSPEFERANNRLRQAIEEMKRSLDRAHRGEGKEAAAEGLRAVQRLEDAGRSLARAQDAGLRAGIDKSLDEARRLQEDQKRIADSVEQLSRRGQQAGPAETQSQREEISGRKAAMADSLRNLADQLEDLARQARGSQNETGARLGDAAGVIRDRRLPERILSTSQLLQNGLSDFARGREDYVRAGLEELQKQIGAAKDSLGQSKESRLEEAFNRTRQLAEGLEAMQRRLADRTPPGRQAGARRGITGSRREEGAPDVRSQESPGRDVRSGGGEQEGAAADQARDAGREGQAGGARSRDIRGATSNATAPPLGPGGHADEDTRQLRSELRQRIADAEELRRLLDRYATQARNLNEVIDALKLMGSTGSYDDPAEVARLRASIGLLQQLELDLSREIGRLGRKDQYLHPGGGEIPRGFEKLVEEYYKALARSNPR